MARQRVLLMLIFVISLAILPPIAHTQDTEVAAAANLLHMVLGIEREATIARVSANGDYSLPQPLSVGTLVRPRDVIDPSGQVLFVCMNDNTIQVLDNQSGQPPCSDEISAQAVELGGLSVIRLRPRSAGRLPLVLYPRNTLLLDERPTIAWTPYQPAPDEADAEIRYDVSLISLQDMSTVWEETGVSGTELSYPAGAVSLLPTQGGDTAVYQVAVSATVDDRTISGIDPFAPEGFCLMDAQQRSEAQAKLDAIQGLATPAWVSTEAKLYHTASVYYSLGLHYDALRLLLPMLPVPLEQPMPSSLPSETDVPGSPAYYILLAQTFYAVRLPNQAELAYSRGNEIAQSLNDRLSQAVIAEQRAEILRGGIPELDPERDEEIVAQYESAIELFTSINDLDSAERLRMRMESRIEPAPTSLCD